MRRRSFLRKTFGGASWAGLLSATTLSCVVPTMPVTNGGSASCTLVVNVAQPDTAGVNTQAAARTVVPAFPTTPKWYTLTYGGPANDSVSFSASTSVATQSIPNLLPGTYTIAVKAYEDEYKTKQIAEGSVTGVILSEGGLTPAQVRLKPTQIGTGKYFLKIKWPTTSANQIEVIRDGTTTVAQSVIMPGYVSIAEAGLSSGVHTLRITFINSSPSTIVGSQLEVINIYDNMESNRFVNADGSLSDIREYGAQEVMDSAVSVNKDVSVRVIAGGSFQNFDYSPAGTTSASFLASTENTITIIPTATQPGQKLEYTWSPSIGTAIALSVTASDAPLTFTLPTVTDTGGGSRANLFAVKCSAPNAIPGDNSVYTLAVRSPIHITNGNNLHAALADLSNNVVLDGPVTLPAGWTPVGGVGGDIGNPNLSLVFNGTFNGDGYTIAGLSKTTTDGGAGLFGAIGSKAVITGVRLKDVAVDGGSNATHGAVGGLVGENFGGTIIRCSVSGSVRGYQWVGGLVGNNRSGGVISECYGTAKVRAQNANSGGLVGGNWGSISNCYARAVVLDCNGSAGLVGYQDATGTVTNCYSSSAIYTTNPASPKAGLVYGLGNFAKSYYNVTLTGTDASFLSNASNIPKSTADMKTASTYSGWDTNGIWQIDPAKNSGYPYLRNVEPETIHINAASMAAADFRALIENNLAGDFILDQSLTLTGSNMTPIGNTFVSSTLVAPFMGTFDGNRKTISGLSVAAQNNAGMFAKIGSGATVKNLRLAGVSNLSGSCTNVGTLAGENQGTVYRCSASGSVSGDDSVGGLVAVNVGTVEECWSNANVTATIEGGGLIGVNGTNDPDTRSGTIRNCYARGTVTARWGGGLAGSNNAHGNIVNSYAAGCVNPNGSSGSAEGNLQELVGKNLAPSNTLHCFYDSSKIAICYGAGAEITSGLSGTGARGRAPCAQAMQSDASWDFTAVWNINTGTNGGYPYLRDTEPTADTPIASQADLANITANLSGDYYLTTSIAISGTWTSIGTSAAPFTGTLDGRRNTITNNVTNHTGLFGWIGVGGTVSDVRVAYPNGIYSVDQYTGGVAGYNEGTIYRCSASGNFTGVEAYLGGIAGSNLGTIKECFSTATLTGTSYVGGIAGNNVGYIGDCYNRRSVTGSYYYCGGITGWQGTTTSKTEYCYSTGSVTGLNFTGGVIGLLVAGNVTNCFYDTISGMSDNTGKGTPKTTDEMKNSSTFTNQGWDFSNVWIITGSDNAGYPYLRNNTPPP